jgi:Ca2+:H+ antiporter
VTWLLIFFPVAIALDLFEPERHLLIFIASSLAILPLAKWMGDATEQLAVSFGEGVGGLLNATFGNAAELIIALAALRVGLRGQGVDCRGNHWQCSASARCRHVGGRIAPRGTAV